MNKTSTAKWNRVRRLLARPLWRKRSTNWLAKTAGVSWAFADKVRTIYADHPVQVLTSNGRLCAHSHS